MNSEKPNLALLLAVNTTVPNAGVSVFKAAGLGTVTFSAILVVVPLVATAYTPPF